MAGNPEFLERLHRLETLSAPMAAKEAQELSIRFEAIDRRLANLSDRVRAVEDSVADIRSYLEKIRAAFPAPR